MFRYGILNNVSKNHFLILKRFLQAGVLKNPYIKVSKEVENAILSKKPVVALESTIITHGMPYPDNVECAVQVEGVVRKQGAVPATVAIIRGKIHVGLSETDINMFGDTKVSKPVKTSRRDLAYVISNQLNGGTTVCGTILVADQVGIPVFATGGIGGVHRGAENTFDISADLIELGKCGVAVISSGVKSILDIPKTLEYLETQGVFVATFGDNNEFPAFYSRRSGCKSPYFVQSAGKAAQIINSSMNMDLKSGMLFAVPIPEEHALPYEMMNEVIQKALKSMDALMEGKQVTPYLLSQVAKLTGGKSLESNIALIKNNAMIAADIAVELAKLRQSDRRGVQGMDRSDSGHGEEDQVEGQAKGGPVIIGGSNLDCNAMLAAKDIKLNGNSYPASFTYTPGGVGRNICEALTRLGVTPAYFATAVGGDDQGRLLLAKGGGANSFNGRMGGAGSTNRTSRDGSNSGDSKMASWSKVKGIKKLEEMRTAECVIVFDEDRESRLVMADFDIHSQISPSMVREMEEEIKSCPLLIMDGNIPVETMEETMKICLKHNVPVFFEPTNIEPAIKPFKTQLRYWKALKFVSPNIEEAKHMVEFLELPTKHNFLDAVDQSVCYAKGLLEYIDNIILTMGRHGVVVGRKNGSATDAFLNIHHTPVSNSPQSIRYYELTDVPRIESVSGAGDCFASGFISAVLAGKPEEICVSVGFAAAKMALQTRSTVPDKLFGREHEAWDKPAVYQTFH